MTLLIITSNRFRASVWPLSTSKEHICGFTLRAHKKLLGENVVIDAPVRHISQTRGIVDLMLSKATKQHKANDLMHLVVELKAPKVMLDGPEVLQIEKYAFSVVEDPRFRNVGTTWVFCVISDELVDYAANRILDSSGIIHIKGNVSIYAKTWAQVLDENRARLKFFQDKLEVQVDKASSLKHLQERYAKYLEGVFEEEDAGSEEAEASEDRAVTPWTSPGTVDTPWPHNEARSNASGLMPPK